ncbi:MAG: hydrogenase maturation nickel metallochaperone HypA [Bryobacterales bacterium]|nr:hydrogenase maturation nickel metallochaperone HypA [Bryobacterales bacterium]
MHETAIALSIVEVAERYSRANGGLPIARIHLRVGAFTSIVPDALQFAFEAMRGGTLAENAVLDIEPVPLTCVCAGCGATASPPVVDLVLVCPRCGGPLEILTGRELQVDYLDLLETVPCVSPNE